jgi:hypothetical protein
MRYLSGLQFAQVASVQQHARQAGVRQQADFPSGPLVSFPASTPFFVPVARG